MFLFIRGKDVRQMQRDLMEAQHLIGVERVRTQTMAKEADFWKEQTKYWQIEASKLSAQLQKIRRKAKAAEKVGQGKEQKQATPQLMTPQNPDFYGTLGTMCASPKDAEYCTARSEGFAIPRPDTIL